MPDTALPDPAPKRTRKRKLEADAQPAPVPPAPVPPPVAEVDPIDAAEAAPTVPVEPPTLPPEVLAGIVSLWWGGNEIAAIRLYREKAAAAGAPDLALDVALAQVRQLCDGASPAPVVVDAAPPTRAILCTKTLDHPFELTPDEFAAKAHRLATLEDEITAEEDRQAGIKRQLKAILSAMQAERHQVAIVVRDRKEIRRVEVLVEGDFSLGVAREIDTASGLILRERPLRDDERQMKLIGDRPPRSAPARDWHDEDDEDDDDPDSDE